MLNVLALFVLSAHLVYVATTASRAVRRRWLLAAAAAVVLLLPLLLASMTQRAQVSWLPKPGWEQLFGFFDVQYAVTPALVALLVLAVLGIGRGTHAAALGLGVAWAVLPPVLLWAASQVHPLFDWRYVFFALPGTALAIGSLATLLRPVYVAVPLLVLASLGWHMQQVYRYPASGHAEDVRGTAEVIGANARAGDAVLFLPASRRVVRLGYPDEFRAVDDIALSADGVSSATLWGVESTPVDVADALRTRTRVWVVTGPRRYGEGDERTEREKQRLLAGEFRLAEATEKYRYEVRLYVRNTRSASITVEDRAGS
jgi:mannosyltransferase